MKFIYFSPTGSTKRIGTEISKTISNECELINIVETPNIHIKKNEVVIIGAPVYSKRIPLQMENFLKKINGHGAKTVIFVSFGNALLGYALKELEDLVKKQNFIPIAGASFIGEHTFSTNEYNVAKGRPDFKDLEKVREFANTIKEKIETLEIISLEPEADKIERSEKLIIAPSVNKLYCILCDLCIKICPVNAISKVEKSLNFDPKKCIYCHACVKNCPQDALQINDSRIIGFSQKLSSLFSDRKEPKFYFNGEL